MINVFRGQLLQSFYLSNTQGVLNTLMTKQFVDYELYALKLTRHKDSVVV